MQVTSNVHNQTSITENKRKSENINDSMSQSTDCNMNCVDIFDRNEIMYQVDKDSQK